MARTNIDVDEEACAEIMRRYHLTTKREVVNLLQQDADFEVLARRTPVRTT